MYAIIYKLLQSLEDPNHPSLGTLLNLLGYVGLWHPDLKSIKPRLKLVTFYITIGFFVSQYVKCILNFSTESFDLILRFLPFHMGVIKTCLFQKDYKVWEDLVKFISSIERKQSIKTDEEQDQIIKYYIGWSKKATCFFFTLVFFSNLAIFGEPYQRNQVTENATVYFNMFEGITPFPKEPPGYYYNMAIQTFFGYVMAFYVITWDMTTVTTMMFFVGQLRMCSLYCSRVICVGNNEQSQKNIAETHEFYINLVLYQKKFNDLVSTVMFVYLIVISVNLGFCIKQLAEVKDDLPTIVTSCLYIKACLVQLLLFYWHSNEVTLESLGVSYSCFESEWVGADVKLQKQVALLAITTTKRMVFKSGAFNEMSLATFVSILRSSYTFYTLLKETS